MTRRRTRAVLLGFMLVAGAVLLPAIARGQNAAGQALSATITRMESDLGARIGVFIHDSGSGWAMGYRENERFLMASTFKSILCGAVLARIDAGSMALDEGIVVRAEEIKGRSPLTERRAGQTLSVEDLCLATLDQSDNGAANLLVDRLGGPQAITEFMVSIGDRVTRLDRKEPGLSFFTPGDPRDTTSPRAMALSWRALLMGTALSPQSQGLLTEWMSLGGVTGPLIRRHLPADWAISDRSGGGRDHTRNIVAMIAPPGKAPYFVAIYLSDTQAN